MKSDSFPVAGGATLDEDLGYIAQSVVIDNNTSSWIYVPGAGRYVPPSGGGAFTIDGTQKAQIKWASPPGKPATPTVAGEEAQVVFSDQPLPPSSGISTNVGARPSLVIRTLNALSVDGVGIGFNATGAAGITDQYVFGWQVSCANAASLNSISAAIKGSPSGNLLSLDSVRYAVSVTSNEIGLLSFPILVLDAGGSGLLPKSDTSWQAGIVAEAANAASIRGRIYSGF